MQIATKLLLGELEWINRFVEKKTTIPVLSTALFAIENKSLTLTGTNLEVAGTTTLAGSAGRQKMSVAAPVQKLIQYLKRVDEEDVTLGVSETHHLVVSHGKDCVKITGMSPESFPELPPTPEKSIKIGRLPLAIERTAFAISADISRFTIDGALLLIDEDEGCLVATDGHRLALAPFQVRCAEKVRAIIPKFALLEAGKIEGECQFAVDDAHAFFTWGGRRVLARKLAGNFPDHERVLPKDHSAHVFIPVKSTTKALQRVALYADERSHAVRFRVGDGKLLMFAEAVETGSAEGSVPYQLGELPAPMEIGLDARYALDFLQRTDAQNVAFCLKDPKSAAEFATSDGYRYVVMPIRI